MKSVYIIAGGILVMMGVVLLAPQNKTSTIAEEKTSSQLDELDAYILKEYGPIPPPERRRHWKNCRPKRKNLSAKKSPITSH